jgi:hypothetical protein
VGHKTGAMRTSENSFKANFRESPECELRRILIPRTPVNKSKRKGSNLAVGPDRPQPHSPGFRQGVSQSCVVTVSASCRNADGGGPSSRCRPIAEAHSSGESTDVSTSRS